MDEPLNDLHLNSHLALSSALFWLVTDAILCAEGEDMSCAMQKREIAGHSINWNFVEPFFILLASNAKSHWAHWNAWEGAVKIYTALALFGLILTPGAAKADGQSDQLACMNDAMAFCGQFIPDRERVAACLISNRGHVSAACRTALTRFNPRTASAR
jgi:hypothetical protein